ncbi:MAG: hypothetical protein IMF18_14245, partial [Proteobacteria bacterium]|nr:hypothetical protein [Pseudomonadota bacterium]
MKVKLKKFQLRMVLAGLCAAAIMFCFATSNVLAEEAAQSKEAAGAPEHKDLGAVGAKLANPLSSLWSLSMNFEMPKFYDGDLNTGDSKVGANMVFQPVLPMPLYGEGAGEWRMITRPVVPIIFSQPVPRGSDDFYNKSGIGDIQLPALLSVPDKYAGKWILGGGPIFMFPSATTDALGADQWAMGPAVVVGYKAKNWTAVLFPNYFWKIGSSGQDDATTDINQGTLLYSFTYKLPDAWQVGMNPTITYNHQASSGNKWNVPVGLFVGKTIKFGKLPVNIKAGLEYSVVSEDD